MFEALRTYLNCSKVLLTKGSSLLVSGKAANDSLSASALVTHGGDLTLSCWTYPALAFLAFWVVKDLSAWLFVALLFKEINK